MAHYFRPIAAQAIMRLRGSCRRCGLTGQHGARRNWKKKSEKFAAVQPRLDFQRDAGNWTIQAGDG